MKTIKKILKTTAYSVAAITMGIGATSCDSMLDTKPQGSFTSSQIGEDEGYRHDDFGVCHIIVPLFRKQ